MNAFFPKLAKKWSTPWLVTLAFLLGLALFSRFWLLGEVPQGMTWDEAALGYIGKMVITTGRDEHNNLLPVTFQSFGDYKTPLAFYLTGVSTTLFGINLVATRFPFAIAGIAGIMLMIGVTALLTRNKWYGLLGGFLLMTTPWHFLFSRVAFETGMAASFFLLLLLSWIWWHEQEKKPWFSLLGMTIGSIGFLYSYHSAKIVFPLAITLLLLIDWRRASGFWKRNLRLWLATLLVIGVLSLPLLFEMILGPGLTRAGQTSFLGNDGVLSSLGKILENLAVHLSPAFLLQGATTTLRHSTGEIGVLLYSQFALLLLGVTFAMGRLFERLYQRRPAWRQNLAHWLGFESQFIPQVTPAWFWLVLLVITLIPAAIGNEIPHPNRAFLAVVPMVVLMVLGVKELQTELKGQRFASIVGTLLLLLLLEFSHFWQYFFTTYQRNASGDWLEGYETAVRTAQTFAEQGKRVKFSNFYGEPEIFSAFFTHPDFQQYRWERIPEIRFGPVSTEDLNEFQIIITPPEQRLPLPPLEVITRQDGETAFLIYEVE